MNCLQKKSILNHEINPFQIFNFDLIVIGSSECGLICAKEAVAHGYRVCVISKSYACEKIREKEILRFLHESFKFKSIFKRAKDFGWKNFDQQNASEHDDLFNWKLLKQKVYETANSTAEKYLTLLMDKRVHYIRSDSVKFLNEHLIIDFDTTFQIFHGENIIITPTVINNSCNIQFPDIIGAKEFGILLNNLTTDLENLNGDILIIGSRRNALTLAAILSSVSNRITLMSQDYVLPNYDQEMINLFIESNQFKYLPKCLIHYIKSVSTSTKRNDDSDHKYEIYFTQLSVEWRQVKYFDRIIFESKYEIDYNEYDLKAANIHISNVPVKNCKFQTNLSHIYLIDDLSDIVENYGYNRIQIGKNLSKHILMKNCRNSSDDGSGRNSDSKEILNSHDKTDLILGNFLDYSFVGMTEFEAKLKYECKNIECYTNEFHTFYNTPFYYSYYPKNFLKIIALKNNEKDGRQKMNQKILGIHLLARNAGDIMQGYAAALRCGITLDCIINCIGIYPTSSWEFTRIKCSENRNRTDDSKSPTDDA